MDSKTATEAGIFFVAGGVVGVLAKQVSRVVIPIAAGVAVVGYGAKRLGLVSFNRKKAEELQDKAIKAIDIDGDGKFTHNDLKELCKKNGVPVAAVSVSAVAGFVAGFKYF